MDFRCGEHRQGAINLPKIELWRSHSLFAFTAFLFGTPIAAMWSYGWAAKGSTFPFIHAMASAVPPLGLGIAGLIETRGGYKRGRWMAVIGTVIGSAMVTVGLASLIWG